MRRVCVKECPTEGDESLKCVPTDDIGCRFSNTTGFEVKYYPTEAEGTRSGMFCMPTDEALKQQLYENSQLEGRDLFYKSIDTVIICFFTALGFSLLYLLLVQFLPRIMNYAAVILGWLVILAFTICIFAYQTEAKAFQVIGGCLLILVLFIILLTTFKNLDCLKIHGVFLQCSTKLVKEKPSILLYIPLFFLFILAFVIIVVLEFTAFWTSGNLSFNPEHNIFHELSGSGPVILTVLLSIQALWGLAFLKMAFNFCVSGEAVHWYFGKNQIFCDPFKYLLCKHLGSVIGGSFVVAFFTIFDFIFDFFKPDYNADPTKELNCYEKTCGPCLNLFDLVRTDAMAYINLTGNPYCNSARYCEYLCRRSVIMDNSQSTSRVYRLCAHILLCGVMAIFAMYVKGAISIYALALIIFNTIFVSTLFISLHADATEAIQVLFLADEELARRDQEQRNETENAYLSGFKLHPELVEEVKKERLEQLQKMEEKKNKRRR